MRWQGAVMKMKASIKDERIDDLFRAILTLQNVDECYAFFEDLCTISEIQEMSRRLWAARMLKDNIIYAEIAEKTGLSTATISRVNKCLKYGSDGYEKALARMAELPKNGAEKSAPKSHS